MLREPINNIEDSKEVEINNIIDDEDNKENTPPDDNIDDKPKKELKTKTYTTEKVICPKCNRSLTKYTFKYRHNCNGPPVKKEPDPNKIIRRKIMHPEQAKEIENNVYNKIKNDIPKVDEEEIEKRVEERLKQHIEGTANKVFETAKRPIYFYETTEDGKETRKY